MAAPGLGIGDIVNACNYIWRKCRDYRDAVKDFDEIASKSKSTVVVIERIADESQENGSLEADNLADLRRRIGLHEKTLLLWYMTLMQGFLRRLKNGQLDIIKAINGIPRDMRTDLIRELKRGNEKPLKAALRSGIPNNEIKNNIEVAKTYVAASRPDQVRIESYIRS
ncbi:hypothetical protein MMC34_005255 [Xylographa carneopallida]|nr:hypothetical protein [Xylographa carneopallida]